MIFSRFLNRKKRRIATRIAIRLLDSDQLETKDGQQAAKTFIQEHRKLILRDSYILNEWLDRARMRNPASLPSGPTSIFFQMNKRTLEQLRDGLERSLQKHKPTFGYVMMRGYFFVLVCLLIAQFVNLIRQFIEAMS